MVVTNYSNEVFSEDGESHYGVLQTYLLSKLDLTPLENEIKKRYYAKNIGRKFHYRIALLLKLWAYMRYHQLSYRTVLHNLTEEDLQNLLTTEEFKRIKTGEFSLPSPSTLHHFAMYRLGDEGLNFLMECLGSGILHQLKMNSNSDGAYGIIDSTPVEASRYSQCATFNPHYNIYMSKAHIISTSGYPLYMIFSEGTEDDGKYGFKLLDAVKSMNPGFEGVLCDKGYDTFLLHAAIFGELGAKPIIAIREDAVIHPEATDLGIHMAVNSQWKKGGDTSATIPEQLKFLYDLDATCYKNPDKYKELVGMYLRNQNLQNSHKIEEILDKRGRCEEMHSQLKDVFKFNIKRCRKQSRSLYVKLDFIAAQCMFLAYLQNNSSKKSLAGYL